MTDNILETVRDRDIYLQQKTYRHQCQWPWVTVKVTFAAWNFSN